MYQLTIRKSNKITPFINFLRQERKYYDTHAQIMKKEENTSHVFVNYSLQTSQQKSSIGGYWNNQKNIQRYLTELREKLQLKTTKDWDKLTYDKIRINGGSSLLKNYSTLQIKTMGCPDLAKTKQKTKKPIRFWENKENVKKFLIEVGKKYNYYSPDDWNKLTTKQIQKEGGSRVLKIYSIYELKCLGNPDVELKYSNDSLNKLKSKGYWDNKENLQNFINKIKKKLNLKTTEDWDKISSSQVKKLGGGTLLQNYSMFDVRCMGCYEYKLKFGSKQIKSKGFWEKKENILNFLNELKQKYNLNTSDDWNKLTQQQIKDNGGVRLVNIYSMFEIRCIGCSEYQLKYSHKMKYKKKPSGYWENDENIIQFLHYFKEKQNLKNIEDWNRISLAQIRYHGGSQILTKYSKDEIIKIANKDFKILHTNLDPIERANQRSAQRWLFLQVQKLFPQDEIIEDYFHAEMTRKTGFSCQFDIFLVQRNIALEYHGEQHYFDIPSAFSSLEMYKSRDKEKEKLCKQFNVHLIIIPYWWNKSLESLKNTIHSSFDNHSKEVEQSNKNV